MQTPGFKPGSPPVVGITDSPQGDYALEDFGHGRRLERLGRWLIDRPAPQAKQAPRRSDWQADWTYDGDRAAAGRWIGRADRQASDDWPVEVAGQTLHCHLADGGQVGLYPEHIACWNWLRALLQRQRATDAAAPPAMLNLFAATGGASLTAAQAGAAVTHVDAQARALTLARDNLAGLQPGVRIIREDIRRFVERALRRGDHYPLIVLDPPSFGRGPKGQTWSLNRDLPALLAAVAELLGPAPLGLWLSAHSPGEDGTTLAARIRAARPDARPQAIRLGLRSGDGRVLDAGHAAVCQWSR